MWPRANRGGETDESTIVRTSGAWLVEDGVPADHVDARVTMLRVDQRRTGSASSVGTLGAGSAADLPGGATNSSNAISESVRSPLRANWATTFATCWKSMRANWVKIAGSRADPNRPPVDDERFLARVAAVFFCQKPMSRYEQRPTPSQPTTFTRKFDARTSTSMKEANRSVREVAGVLALVSSCM